MATDSAEPTSMQCFIVTMGLSCLVASYDHGTDNGLTDVGIQHIPYLALEAGHQIIVGCILNTKSLEHSAFVTA